ncbi:MAG: cyclic nucleotide-binding domain-containing protein [Thaumarchaeota archaeon]|nr:cyclic nucleotide-binding domain-containing protein [Nitrososphaerota archaeon]
MVGDLAVTDALANVPFFSGLNKKLLKTIENNGKEVDFKQGVTVVKQGDLGVGFFLILDGQVEVRKGGKVLAKLSRGQFFGEMSLVDDMPRSADVVAVQPTRCFALTTWSFSGILKANPEMAMPLLKEVVKRLRSAQSAPTS